MKVCSFYVEVSILLIIFKISLIASEIQVESHLVQLVQDLRVLADNYHGCQESKSACMAHKPGAVILPIGMRKLSHIPVEHHTSPLSKYKLTTWYDAKAVCNRMGLNMATTAQLQDAWSKGYDKCRCGWLADGTVKYPITNIRPGCGSSPGLNTCGDPTKGVDVYCSTAPISVQHHTSPNGTYKLKTWDDAKSVCARMGLNMATTAQLQDAWSKGYDMCRCGWLADGTAKYPITNIRPGCGRTPGLTSCDEPTEGFDVYCSSVPVPVEHIYSSSGWYKIPTWEDALSECAKYGLTLATKAQLDIAWSLGYDQCSCGWLADGTVKYPVTKPRNGCGGTVSGLITCSADPKQTGNEGYNAYCSKIPIPVVHHSSTLGGYKLATWEDAKAECDKHGLTMATTAHLKAAWEAGYDKCACGWLADGTVKYPVTKPREGCGGASAGLISCNADPKSAKRDGWDVYCFTGY